MNTAGKITASLISVACVGAVGTAALMLDGSMVRSSLPDASMPATTSATPTPTFTVIAARGSQGERVTQVQKYLRRLGHLTVEPTGYYGDLTVAGVTKFQAREGLKQTGAVDEKTWSRLKTAAANLPDPAPSKTPSKDPTTTPTTTPPKNTANLDRRCLTGRVICINKSAHRIYWVIDGQVQNDWSIRHGRPGMDTREGTFAVYQKDVKSWSYLYNVWMPYSMYFSGGQAIHYSEEFATYGYSKGGSHGCVNMRDYAGIRWLYGQVRLGDKVVVYS